MPLLFNPKIEPVNSVVYAADPTLTTSIRLVTLFDCAILVGQCNGMAENKIDNSSAIARIEICLLKEQQMIK
jgi:hypothetical protein